MSLDSEDISIYEFLWTWNYLKFGDWLLNVAPDPLEDGDFIYVDFWD